MSRRRAQLVHQRLKAEDQILDAYRAQAGIEVIYQVVNKLEQIVYEIATIDAERKVK